MKKLLVLFLAAIISGCSHAISEKYLEQADREISFVQLKHDPKEFQGKMVILGGVIVNTVNRDDGSLLEVYQTRTNRLGEPVDLDESEGRFLVFHERLLDPEIFSKGRRITVAGRIQGEKTGKLGEMEYRYPLIYAQEIRLWEEKPAVRYEPYPRDPWHYPYPYRRLYHPYYHPYPWW